MPRQFCPFAGHRQHTARARARARTHDRRQARTSGQRVACDAHDVRVLAGTETIQRTVSARAAIPRVLFGNVGEIIPGHPVPPCDARFGRCVASLHAGPRPLADCAPASGLHSEPGQGLTLDQRHKRACERPWGGRLITARVPPCDDRGPMRVVRLPTFGGLCQ